MQCFNRKNSYYELNLQKRLIQLETNWSFVSDGDATPDGFSFAGIAAGLKLSLIHI